MLTQELEVELQQANLRRTRTEKIVEDYRAGLGSERERTSLLLSELQKYLSEAQETHAFKQLLNIVDALKISVDSQTKIEQLINTQLTVEDLNALASSFNVIQESQKKQAAELAKLVEIKTADLQVTRELCNLIKKELEA